jgi:hypothetical protein
MQRRRGNTGQLERLIQDQQRLPDVRESTLPPKQIHLEP